MSNLFDIVIVGGGMTGAALGAAIAKNPHCANLRLALIDAGQESPPASLPEGQACSSVDAFDSRVVALSERSRELLDSIGAWSAITEQRACAYRAMQVWDGEGTGSIGFHADDVHAAELGHIVENRCITHALYQQLQTLPAVSLFAGRVVKSLTLSGGEYQVQVEAADPSVETINARLLIGADGAKSFIREWSGLPVRDWDYGHKAIVATVKTSRPHQYTCWQRFTSNGPLAFLPLQVGADGAYQEYYCSLVWSATTELADELMALDADAFAERLESAFEARLGRVEQVSERHAIPLRQRHAHRYIADQLALVGDAAHTIHPLAGQGVNLGFYDVAALASEIARACRRGIPVEDGSVLRRYQRSRKVHNLSAMATMEGFKRLFGADDLGLRWIRNTGMTFMDNQLFLKKQLTRFAQGS